MPAETGVTINENTPEWSKIVAHVIETVAVPRMKRVADACNTGLPKHPKMEAPENYMVSSEGGEALAKRQYRATVITATGEAMRNNAKTNALVKNFHLAGGDL